MGIINGVRAALDAEAARIAAGGSVRRLPTTDPQYLRLQVQQIINTTEVNFGELGFLGDTIFKNIFSTTTTYIYGDPATCGIQTRLGFGESARH